MKQFKKEDFKTGHLVITDNGIYTFLGSEVLPDLNSKVFFSRTNADLLLDWLDDDLIFYRQGHKKLCVIRSILLPCNEGYIFNEISHNDIPILEKNQSLTHELVWKRDEEIESGWYKLRVKQDGEEFNTLSKYVNDEFYTVSGIQGIRCFYNKEDILSYEKVDL